MIVIGELINATRRSISEAIQQRDSSYIREIASKQMKNNASYIDVNAGTGKGQDREIEDMKWLIEIINELDAPPVCIDSSNPSVIEHCLPFVRNKDVMVNSINGEKERIDNLLPVIKENAGCKVIALTMDDRGIPQGVDRRLEIARNLVAILGEAGVEPENIFIDALVQPVSVDGRNGRVFFETIAGIKREFQGVHMTCGLSNVSFGLPGRRLLNKYFLAMAISHGLDSIIADPVDKGIREAICLGEALNGDDEFCMNYIGMYRG